MTDQSQAFDIVIVGGGLVGSALAARLGQADRNLSIALLDAGSEPVLVETGEFDPRVVALTRQSQQLFIDINAWADIQAVRACPYTDMHVWDGDGTGNIHFNCHDINQANLGHIVENRVALASIYQQLRVLDNVHLLLKTRVVQLAGSEAQRQIVLDDGRSLSAQLIIAADGGHSKIRELAAIDVKEWAYGHKAIVSTVTCQEPHQYTAWQRFTRTGPLAFLPLQQQAQGAEDEYQCSLVWSQQTQVADELMALEEAKFNEQLARAFEYRLGAISHSDRRYCFPLTARHARDYFRPGLVLVGDAAHSIHPLAGQGVNLGFADAAVLAEEIFRARQRSIALSDESILRRYQRRRKPHNLITLAVMEGFKQLFGADDLAVRWLRNTGLKQVNHLSWMKNTIAREILGAQHSSGGVR